MNWVILEEVDFSNWGIGSTIKDYNMDTLPSIFILILPVPLYATKYESIWQNGWNNLIPEFTKSWGGGFM